MSGRGGWGCRSRNWRSSIGRTRSRGARCEAAATVGISRLIVSPRSGRAPSASLRNLPERGARFTDQFDRKEPIVDDVIQDLLGRGHAGNTFEITDVIPGRQDFLAPRCVRIHRILHGVHEPVFRAREAEQTGFHARFVELAFLHRPPQPVDWTGDIAQHEVGPVRVIRIVSPAAQDVQLLLQVVQTGFGDEHQAIDR